MGELILPEPHIHQKEILNSEARFRVVACGRRFGKTTLGERSILIRASERGQACWWLAPTYNMADHVWRDLKSAVRDLPGVQISQSDLRMDFPGGGWLAIHSTHIPQNLLGAGLDFVVLDEAAYMPPDIWPEIVRPMLVERQGRALFLSTPHGRNWFWEIYQLGLSNSSLESHLEPETTALSSHPATQGENFEARLLLPPSRAGEGWGGGSDTTIPLETETQTAAFPPPLYEVGRGLGDGDNLWHTFHFPSDQNPLLPAVELESIRLQTPEYVWTQEYLAQFTDNAGQVFRGIREAATAPLNPQPNPETRYAVGLDWGRENDYTAVVVIDSARKEVVALDRFNQVNWSLQRGRLKAICDRWNPVVIWAEANSIGSPNIEALQTEGLPVRPFQTTASSKPDLIDSLSLAIERKELALLPDENLLAELASYSLERLPAGGYRYSAPPGLHDDLVIALALAWYAANHSSLPISFA